MIAPILAALSGVSGFLVSYDFSDLRKAYPNWPRLFDILEDHRVFIWFLLFVFLSFLVSIAIAFLSPTRQLLRKQLEAEQQKISAITDHVDFTLQGFVWEQARRMGFSEEGFSRISLYMHDANTERFHCLVRRSHNSKFEKKGRTFFDDNVGCISKAWENSWHFDNEFPDDPKEDAEYQRKTYGIKKSEHASLTMPSKLIAAKKILDKEDRPIGLLVLESVKRDAFMEADLRAKLSEAATDCAHLLITWKDHLPSPSIAESEGL